MRGLLGWLKSPDGTASSVHTDLLHYGEHFGDSQLSALDDEERMLLQRRMHDPRWTIDRGAGRYKERRANLKKPSLVETGRHAGRSRVLYTGVESRILLKHIWKRDFFGAAANASLLVLILALVVGYLVSFWAWATLYYVAWMYDDMCFIGFVSFQSAFLFAIETQQTIGFGVRAPGDCWAPAWLMALHSIYAMFINSIFLGIIFAKISLPKNRSRTILISDCAVIARRDGVLKFMFRIADIRKRTVIAPSVRVAMYRWGGGHSTSEGEHLQVDVQELKVNYFDPLMLLPVTIEHTIDETSPLHGLTQHVMEAEGAEIVVSFEGTNEFGDAFMTRRSYLPSEVFWGHVFVPIIRHAPPGHTQHHVDIARFHDVEPQFGHDELIPPSQMSRRVLMAGRRSLPPPSLGDNTLVLSSDCVVASRNGQLRLMFRVGDTRPGQMQHTRLRAFIIRWNQPPRTEEGEELPFTCHELKLTAPSPLLRYPYVVSHPITATSPIRSWASAEGMLNDADAEVVVTVEAVVAGSHRLATRSRTYDVLGHVKWGFVFAPCVVPPSQMNDSKAGVDWGSFHSLLPLHAGSHTRRASSLAEADDAWPRSSSHVSEGCSPPNAAMAPDPRLAPAYAGAVGARGGMVGGVEASAGPDSTNFGSGFDVGEGSQNMSRAPSVAVSTSSWGAAARSTPTTPPNSQATGQSLPRDSWHHNRSLAAVFHQFQAAQEAQAAALQASPATSTAPSPLPHPYTSQAPLLQLPPHAQQQRAQAMLPQVSPPPAQPSSQQLLQQSSQQLLQQSLQRLQQQMQQQQQVQQQQAQQSPGPQLLQPSSSVPGAAGQGAGQGAGQPATRAAGKTHLTPALTAPATLSSPSRKPPNRETGMDE